MAGMLRRCPGAATVSPSRKGEDTTRVAARYGDWLVPSFVYGSMRYACQALGLASLPLYPKRSKVTSALAKATHWLLDDTWLQIHTAACIDVICWK